MKSQVLNINIPIHLIDLTTDELKHKLATTTTPMKYDGLSLRYSIRLHSELTRKIKTNAKLKKMTILDYTAALLNNEEA